MNKYIVPAEGDKIGKIHTSVSLKISASTLIVLVYLNNDLYRESW